MASRERRFTLDTNIFIHAARDPYWAEELIRFHAAFAPFEVLSAVVVQELLAGVRGNDAKRLQRALIDPFERRQRIIVPTYTAWKETGMVLSELVGGGRAKWADVSRSFVNDVLLAMCCREAGVVLVTGNAGDFARIAKVRAFDYALPWPTPSS